MSSQPTKLSLNPREASNSRATRRLRRAGRIPGVIYGGGADPVPFDVDARVLRHALAARGAVLELAIGSDTTPAVLKDAYYDPVRGDTLHVDFLRVRLDVAIHATVLLELTGVDDAPGVKEGAPPEQATRELNIEALPGDIPESIEHDVSQLVIGDTVTLEAVKAPRGVTLLDDPEETVIATLNPPNVDVDAEEDALEQETELVGEGEEGDGEAGDEGSEGDASAEAGDDDSE